MEPLNRYRTSVINTVEQLLPLLADIGCGNVGIHYDTYHACLEEANLLASLETALKSGRVTHFHACANNRGAPATALCVGRRDAAAEAVRLRRGISRWKPLPRAGWTPAGSTYTGTPDEVALRGLHFLQRYF